MTTKPTFNQFGNSFQEKIMQALLTDRKWAQQMEEIIDVEYFDLEYLKYLAKQYFAYFKKYKDFPTLQLLITVVKDDFKTTTKKNDALLTQIISYITKMKTNPDVSDLKFVKDKSFDFCRRQAFKRALEDAVELVLVDQYDDIVNKMKHAISVGTPVSVGHDFFEDYEARFTLMARSPVPTGLKELDKKHVFNGGVGRGELAVVCAPTGVGKSHFLTMLGCNALKAGLNVMHYTFELSETVTGIRYDSNLCDINSTYVPESKEKIIQQYADDGKKMGRLFIKEYPTNYASINTLRAHLEKLQLQKNFRPDIILVDYADVMRSTHKYDSLRHELKLVYEELRGWASEADVPIWTASQINREGSNNDVIELKNISEAYGKAMVADIVVSISRKISDKHNGTGRLHVAKNRAGRDGLVYNVAIDTSKSKFEVINEYESVEAAQSEGKKEIDSMLKSKWKELRNDPIIDLKKVAN